MVVAYRPDAEGRLRPEIPREGPCRTPGGSPCRLAKHSWRERKTGPGYPLRVLDCSTHSLHFTLYPYGHIPYGRRAVAPVTPDGASTGSTTTDAFVGTVFGAALDASHDRAWARESGLTDDPGWASMGRDLRTATVWVGVAPELHDKEREARAADLDVDLLPLLDGARAITEAPGYRSRGRAVMAVLDELPSGRPLLERLLRAGHTAGLFGEPLVAVVPGGPLRSLIREHLAPDPPSGSRDPPRKRDVPAPRRGS